MSAAPEYPLLTHVDSLMDELRGRVPGALKQWDEEAIHQARVSTRRLKAALDLMEPVLGKRHRRPLGRVLRQLRRRLGPLRDADVMIGHLSPFARVPRHAAAATWLTRHLCGEREALRAASAQDAPPARVLSKLGAWWAVREEMAEAREAVPSLLAQSMHLQLDAFAEQSDRLIGDMNRRAVRLVPDAPPAAPAPGPAPGDPPAERAKDHAVQPAEDGAEADPQPASPAPAPAAVAHQDPHELRITGKLLRYTLEMAAVQDHPLPKSVGKTFKRMQESLGLWHDFVVLSDHAMRVSLQTMLGHHDPGLQEQVLELARVFLRRSAQQLDGFARLWTEEGEELARTIRAAFPLTRPAEPVAALDAEVEAAPAAAGDGEAGPVSGPRTDPGPPGSGETAAPGACPPASPSAA